MKEQPTTFTRTIVLFKDFGIIEKNPNYQPVPEYNDFTGEIIDNSILSPPRKNNSPYRFRFGGGRPKRDKKSDEMKLKETERIQKDGDRQSMVDWVKTNNAAMKHLVTFVTLANYATDNNRGIALGSFKKLVSRKDVQKVWKQVLRYLGKYSVDGGLACSIGIIENGWVTLRVIGVTNGEDQTPMELTLPFYDWLLRHGWKDTTTASDGNAKKLLDHYLLRPVGAEVFDVYAPEMFEVARAQLAVDGTRTYRNSEATTIIDRQWRDTEESHGSFAVARSGRAIVTEITLGDNGEVLDCLGFADGDMVINHDF